MKNCKSCNKEIDDIAKKCPHCQAFQNWYRNPQIIASVFPLLILPYIFFTTSLFSKENFEDYQSFIKHEKVSETTTSRNLVFTYKIINNSDLDWENIDYQLIGKNEKGVPVIVESKSEYSWSVLKNSESLLSIKISKDQPDNINWSFQIIKMKHPRF